MLLLICTTICIAIIFLVIFSIWDYITTMTPFWIIEKRYKKQLDQLNKRFK